MVGLVIHWTFPHTEVHFLFLRVGGDLLCYVSKVMNVHVSEHVW